MTIREFWLGLSTHGNGFILSVLFWPSPSSFLSWYFCQTRHSMLNGFPPRRRFTRSNSFVRLMLESQTRRSSGRRCENLSPTLRVGYSCETISTRPSVMFTANILLSLHMFFNELPNNTSQQLPLIVVGFGFTPAESALFNIIKPIWGLILILGSAVLLYSTRLGTGYTCAISYIPCFVGGIIEVSECIFDTSILAYWFFLSSHLRGQTRWPW